MTPELKKMLEDEATAQEALRDELEKNEFGGATNDNVKFWDNFNAFLRARVKAERIRSVLEVYPDETVKPAKPMKSGSSYREWTNEDFRDCGDK
jgi:hypothetical protein